MNYDLYWKWKKEAKDGVNDLSSKQEKLQFLIQFKRETRDGLLKNDTNLQSLLDWIDDLIEDVKIESESKQDVLNKENPFSGFEWTSIWYFANETKALPRCKTQEESYSKFNKEHDCGIVNFKTFKSRLYDVRKRLDKTKDYPIEKLNKILIFCNEYYEVSVPVILKYIELLTEEQKLKD